VVGAGNLTFSRIKSGQRKYMVTKDGYQAASGVINVPSDATVTIEVALNPTVETRTTLTVKDMYDQSVAKMKAGDVENAIAGFSSLLDQHPQYTPAYMARAEAYTLASRRIDAHDDYLRAAEILRINGDYGQAMTGFNNAIKMVPTSVPALLGRAGLHMARQEEIAAIADYEAILQVDKRSAQANFGLGEARFAQGNYKQAIKHFKDARSDDPGNALIYQYLMLCYFGDDDLKNVKKSYDKFKEMATQDEVQQLHQDKAYTAVLRVVQNEQ
jgi:tetratricopeptide (TPR) repeat protein